MHQKVFKQLVLNWAVYELLCFTAPTSGVQLQLQALSDDTQLEEPWEFSNCSRRIFFERCTGKGTEVGRHRISGRNVSDVDSFFLPSSYASQRGTLCLSLNHKFSPKSNAKSSTYERLSWLKSWVLLFLTYKMVIVAMLWAFSGTLHQNQVSQFILHIPRMIECRHFT